MNMNFLIQSYAFLGQGTLHINSENDQEEHLTDKLNKGVDLEGIDVTFGIRLSDPFSILGSILTAASL